MRASAHSRPPHLSEDEVKAIAKGHGSQAQGGAPTANTPRPRGLHDASNKRPEVGAVRRLPGSPGSISPRIARKCGA